LARRLHEAPFQSAIHSHQKPRALVSRNFRAAVAMTQRNPISFSSIYATQQADSNPVVPGPLDYR
jgi:hypothetical protein